MTPKQFLEKVKKLEAEHEEEYKVYIEVPEMHPEYKSIFQVFINQYFDKSKDQDAQWTLFWSKQVEEFKSKEWDEKKKALVAKYRRLLAADNTAVPAKVNVGKVFPEAEQSQHAAPIVDNGLEKLNPCRVVDVLVRNNAPAAGNFQDEQGLPKIGRSEHLASIMVAGLENFNVRDAVDAIRLVVGYVGDLAPGAMALLDVVEKKGFTTIEAFDVFADENNYTLVNLCIKKLEKVKPRIFEIRNALRAAKSLPEYCRRTSKRMKDEKELTSGLDLYELACETMSYSTSQMIKRVKLELEKIGDTDLSLDKLNEIYTTYNSIRSNITLQKSESTSTTATQPEASMSNGVQHILGESSSISNGGQLIETTSESPHEVLSANKQPESELSRMDHDAKLESHIVLSVIPAGYCVLYHSRNRVCVSELSSDGKPAHCPYKHSCPKCPKMHTVYEHDAIARYGPDRPIKPKPENIPDGFCIRFHCSSRGMNCNSKPCLFIHLCPICYEHHSLKDHPKECTTLNTATTNTTAAPVITPNSIPATIVPPGFCLEYHTLGINCTNSICPNSHLCPLCRKSHTLFHHEDKEFRRKFGHKEYNIKKKSDSSAETAMLGFQVSVKLSNVKLNNEQ